MANAKHNFLKLFSANLLTKVIGFAALIFYVRYLSKEELSFIAYYEMLGGMGTLFFGFGILPTFVRELPEKLRKDFHEAKKFINTGSIILISGVILFSVLVFILSTEISVLLTQNSKNSYLFKLISIGVLFSGIQTITSNLFWVSSRFSQLALINTINPLLKHSLSIPLVIMFGIKGLLIGLIINSGFRLIISAFLLRDIIFKDISIFHSPFKLLKESFPFYLESYLMYFRSQGDNWIVSTYLGINTLATYYVARKVYFLFNMVMKSAGKIITTRLGEVKNENIKVSLRTNEIEIFLLKFAAPGFLFVIGVIPSLIWSIGGEKYVVAIVPCLLLSLSALFDLLFVPYKRAVFFIRLPLIRFKLTLLESISLISLLIILTPLLNLTGIALSRAFGALISGFLAILFIKERVKIDISTKLIVESLILPLVSICVLLILQFFYLNIYFLFLYVSISILIFVTCSHIIESDIYYDYIALFKKYIFKRS